MEIWDLFIISFFFDKIVIVILLYVLYRSEQVKHLQSSNIGKILDIVKDEDEIENGLVRDGHKFIYKNGEEAHSPSCWCNGLE